MTDRRFLRSMAALIESVPALGKTRKELAERFRRIADLLDKDQDTSEPGELGTRGTVETVITDGLPRGVIVFVAPPPSPNMAPLVTGSAIGGEFFGQTNPDGWAYVCKEDADIFSRLTVSLSTSPIESGTPESVRDDTKT